MTSNYLFPLTNWYIQNVDTWHTLGKVYFHISTAISFSIIKVLTTLLQVCYAYLEMGAEIKIRQMSLHDDF
jgi:hypothetical protein